MIFVAVVLAIIFVMAVLDDPLHAVTTILAIYLVKVLYDFA